MVPFRASDAEYATRLEAGRLLLERKGRGFVGSPDAFRGTAAEYAAAIARELKQWKDVAVAGNIKIQ
jgi:hypothetical protein